MSARDELATTFREGDVVTYNSDRGNNWCREGIAIVQPNGRIADTYWQGMTETHMLTGSEIATAELRFNLADFREVERYESPGWDEYHPNDREVITSQHGLCRRLLIRIGSGADRGTQIENARRAVEDAESKMRSAESNLRWAKQKLADLEPTP